VRNSWLVLFVTSLLLIVNPVGAVEIGGSLAADETEWGPQGSGAQVEGDPTIDVTSYLTIGSSLTLTILPGTTVRMAENQEIFCNGQIIAKGTADQPIVFTSLDPNAGAGTWIAVTLNVNRYGSVFEYCHFSNAFQGISTYLAYPTIKNCRFESCLEGIYLGLWDQEDSPVIEQNLFVDNTIDGLTSASSLPTVRRNTFRGNTIAVVCTGIHQPDLGDVNGDGPGENRFEASVDFHITLDRMTGVLMAEGNVWDEATYQEMLAKGYPANITMLSDDWDDDGELNGSCAHIDYDPFRPLTAIHNWFLRFAEPDSFRSGPSSEVKIR